MRTDSGFSDAARDPSDSTPSRLLPSATSPQYGKSHRQTQNPEARMHPLQNDVFLRPATAMSLVGLCFPRPREILVRNFGRGHRRHGEPTPRGRCR